MPLRIMILLISVILAYTALRFGDFPQPYLMQWNDEGSNRILIVGGWATIFVCAVAGGVLMGVLAYVVSQGTKHLFEVPTASVAALQLVCSAMVLGAAALPFTHYGSLSLFLAGPWAFWFFLVLVPTALVLYSIVADLLRKWNKTLPLRETNVPQSGTVTRLDRLGSAGS